MRGTRARRIPWRSSGTTRIRDIGWTSPTTIEVLDRLSRSQAEVRILDVDGSTSPDETTSDPDPRHGSGLATSPVGRRQTPYAVLRAPALRPRVRTTRHGRLATDDRHPGLRHVTYAG